VEKNRVAELKAKALAEQPRLQARGAHGSDAGPFGGRGDSQVHFVTNTPSTVAADTGRIWSGGSPTPASDAGNAVSQTSSLLVQPADPHLNGGDGTQRLVPAARGGLAAQSSGMPHLGVAGESSVPNQHADGPDMAVHNGQIAVESPTQPTVDGSNTVRMTIGSSSIQQARTQALTHKDAAGTSPVLPSSTSVVMVNGFSLSEDSGLQNTNQSACIQAGKSSSGLLPGFSSVRPGGDSTGACSNDV
jgi:hypothetical protein